MPGEDTKGTPGEFMTADDLMSDPLGLRRASVASAEESAVHEDPIQTQAGAAERSQATSGIPIPAISAAVGASQRPVPAVQVAPGLEALISEMAAEVAVKAEPSRTSATESGTTETRGVEVVGGVDTDQELSPSPPATAPPKIITRPRRQRRQATPDAAPSAPLVVRQPPRHWVIQQWQDVADAFSRFEPRAVLTGEWWNRWWPAVVMPLLSWAAAGLGAIVMPTASAWAVSLGIIGIIVGYAQIADCEDLRKKIHKER